MSSTIGIEIALEPGSTSAPGAALAGAGGSGPRGSGLAQPGEGTLRASWLSILASAGAGLRAPGNPGASTNGIETPATNAFAPTASGTPSAPAPPKENSFAQDRQDAIERALPAPAAQPEAVAALNKPASFPVQASLLQQPAAASAALATESEDSGDGLHFEASSKNARRQNDANARPLAAQNAPPANASPATFAPPMPIPAAVPVPILLPPAPAPVPRLDPQPNLPSSPLLPHTPAPLPILAKNPLIIGAGPFSAPGNTGIGTGSNTGLNTSSMNAHSLNSSDPPSADALLDPGAGASIAPPAARRAASFSSGFNADGLASATIPGASATAAQPAADAGPGANPIADPNALSAAGPDSDLGSLSAASAGAAKPGAAGDKSPQAEAAARAVHSAGSAEPVASAAQVVPLSPVAALTETSALAHSPGAHAQPAAGLPASTPVSPAAPNTFAALDAHSGPAAASWTRTGAQSVEAGYNDPSLGWVGVRADLGAAGVHAAVVPGSAEAAQALAGQMPGLHSYLSEQRVGVGSLTLATPEGSGAGAGLSQGRHGPGQEPNQGLSPGMGQAGANAQQHSAPDAQAGTNAFASSAVSRAAPTEAGATGASMPLAVPSFEGAGTYISVMA
jgi:hypothetical protein